MMAATLNVLAQEKVSIEVAVPHRIVAGEHFSVQFVVNTNKAKDIKLPVPTGLSLLYGPAEATSTSVSIVNGNMSRKSSKTYTYTFLAEKEGEYTIPSATIRVGSSSYKTKEKRIKVFSQSAVYGSSNTNDSTPNESSATRVSTGSGKDFFVTVNAGKRTVYEQEGFLVTFKLYALNPQFEFMDVKFPEFDGFVKQEIPMDNVRQLNVEEYKGRAYYTLNLSQFLIFPQKSGSLTIPSGSFDLLVSEREEDPVFGSFGSIIGQYTQKQRTVKSSPFSIQVKPLPTPKPDGFNGAVGRFDLSEEVPVNTIKTNESYTRKLKLEGIGNLKLIELPEINFPEGFEAYDPKEEDDIAISGIGESGWKTKQYFAVPRFKGDYVIPEIKFVYFDVNQKQYKTITLPERKVHVDQGTNTPTTSEVSNYNKEDVKVLNQDIRYLKEVKDTDNRPSEASLTGYLIGYLISIVIGLIVFFVTRYRRSERIETIETRAKNAGSMAKKYLKLASKKRTSGDDLAYYEALLRGLDNYLSAKFHIPTSELFKDNISSRMESAGLAPELIQQTIETQSELEMARYTPDGGLTQKDELYDKAAAVIDNIQSSKVKIKP